MRCNKMFSIVMVSIIATASFVVLSERAMSAQRSRTFRWDSGIVTLGANQQLRLNITSTTGSQALKVDTEVSDYLEGGVTQFVSRLVLAGQNQLPRMTIPPGEGVSLDVANSARAVRAVIRTDSARARVTVHVIDTTTGQTVSLYSSADFDTL